MLQCTREQLLECRQAAPAAIPHRTRKVLFTFRLWRPRSVSVHAHLSRHNWGVTKVKVNTQKQQSRLHARQIRLATLNAFSVRNKSAPLSVALTDNDLDVFMLTESWHKQQDDLAVRMVCPPGYKSVDAPRSNSAVGRRKQRGGGIVLLHKEGIAAKRLTFSAPPTTFELLGAQMTSSFARSMVVVIGVYCPGGESVASEFFDELSAVLEQLAALQLPSCHNWRPQSTYRLRRRLQRTPVSGADGHVRTAAVHHCTNSPGRTHTGRRRYAVRSPAPCGRSTPLG